MLHLNKEYLEKNYIELRRPIKEIALECGVCVGTIEQTLRKFGLTNIRSRIKNPINNNRICESPEMYYFMGLIATDGYISLKTNRVAIRLRNNGASELLNAIKEYFEFPGEVRIYAGKDYDLTMTSRELITFLEQHNICGENKTFNVDIPDYYPNEDCARMFMRGVLDGDGNIHFIRKGNKITQYEFRLVTGSLSFIDSIRGLFNTYLNIDTSLKVHRVKGKEYPAIFLTNSESKKFYSWVYQGYQKFRLKDKFEKASQIVEDIV